MSCGNFFPIQKAMRGFQFNRQVVWAVFDCDRVQSGAAGGDRDVAGSDEEDKDEEPAKHGTVFTFAADQGKAKPELNHSTFAIRLGMHMTRFLNENKGSFNLNCLSHIPSYLAKTAFNAVPKDVTIFAKKPDQTWSGEDNYGKQGEGTLRFKSGDTYEGNMQDSQRSGQGT